MGTAEFQGMKIDIENLKGSVREGVGPDGKKWKTTMPAAYGELRKTEGTDGDKVDVYLGENPEAEKVYVVTQNHPQSHPTDPGGFDEDKVFLGFDSPQQVEATYQSAYSDPTYFGGMTVLSVEQFKGKAFSKKFKGEKIASYPIPRLSSMDMDTPGVSGWDFYYDKAKDRATAVPVRPEWVNKEDKAFGLQQLQRVLESRGIRPGRGMHVSNTSPKVASENQMNQTQRLKQAYDFGFKQALEALTKQAYSPEQMAYRQRMATDVGDSPEQRRYKQQMARFPVEPNAGRAVDFGYQNPRAFANYQAPSDRLPAGYRASATQQQMASPAPQSIPRQAPAQSAPQDRQMAQATQSGDFSFLTGNAPNSQQSQFQYSQPAAAPAAPAPAPAPVASKPAVAAKPAAKPAAKATTKSTPTTKQNVGAAPSEKFRAFAGGTEPAGLQKLQLSLRPTPAPAERVSMNPYRDAHPVGQLPAARAMGGMAQAAVAAPKPTASAMNQMPARLSRPA